MSLESDADRLALLQAVGEPIVLDGASVWSVFGNAYIESLDVSGSQPVATCRTSDVTAVTRASTVVHAGITYRVAVIQPDGTGMTQLVLERT